MNQPAVEIQSKFGPDPLRVLADLAAQDYKLAGESFIHFFRAAWPILEPSAPLLNNWHQECIAEHLQATLTGDIKRLIINVPPRYSKSLMVTVMFPAWCWINDPSLRFINASYSEDLATKHNVDRRLLMRSLWYQTAWGHKFQFSEEQNQKTEYVNDKRGHMVAAGMLGTVTGKGGDCFPGDTLVSTEIGMISIRELHEMRPKPLVWSFNHETACRELKRIEASRVVKANRFAEVFAGGKSIIRSTHKHKIFTGRGYIEAKNIRVTDSLFTFEGGRISPEKLWQGQGPWENVFDIQVADNRNFFANNILVHNCVIIDDPHNPKKAESDKERAAAVNAFDSTFTTRLDNKKTGRMIVVMQRLHFQDLTGHLLNKKSQGEDWVHLKLPAEAPRRTVITFPVSKKKIVREKNDILHPEREGPKELKVMKIALGSYGYAGQYDQNPTPRVGGLFKKTYWRYYTALPQKFDQIILSWDMSFKDLTSSDEVCGFAMGIVGADIYIFDCENDQWGFSKTCEALKRMSLRHPLAIRKLVEDKANGPAVIDYLKSKIAGLIAENPEGSKMERAALVEPIVESGNVHLPHPSIAPPWVQKLIDQAAAFPKGDRDDMVDAMTQGIKYLMPMALDRLRALGTM